jgi:ribosomal protein L7/L12
MKIILSHEEAAAMIAAQYHNPLNTGAPTVTIESPSTLHSAHIQNTLINFYREAAKTNTPEGANRVSLMIAVRTLTGCTVKEAKDFVENYF